MIHIEGANFKDEYGRTIMLRGVNLAGSSKVPRRPNGATYNREGFFNHQEVSFVGRPFPLVEADEHFQRLRRWGLTTIRLLVTWEAIEHAGPGIYDEEYLDYLGELVSLAGEHGMTLIIDPHQDVWSRFTGGDGAPGWTLEKVGFNLAHFKETGAAIVHATHGDPFPQMIWPTNGSKLAAATMYTLFFAGNDFAPKTLVEGEPIQEFLQRHYLQAIQKVAERMVGFEHVIGYDVFNEPEAGYIGWKDLSIPGGPMLLGACPSPYQSMLLGEGIPQEVGVWVMKLVTLERTSSRWLNLEKQRAWRSGCADIWRENGVWDYDARGQPHLLRSDYFTRVGDHEVDFVKDYYPRFCGKFTSAIREIDPGAAIFIEGEPGGWPPGCLSEEGQNLVYSPHWYDAFVLVKKQFSPWLAVDRRTLKPVWMPWNIRKSFAEQIAFVKRGSDERLGDAPVVMEEFGIPFDLNRKVGYRTGDFSTHEKALDRTFQALDANLLHATIWNYNPDNTNERGDLWNDEDFSIFSHDQQKNPTDPDSGGRALRAVVRPYPKATAGEPVRMSFDMRQRTFEYVFRHDPAISEPTEIFLPRYQYPKGCRVEVSDGRYELTEDEQKLKYWYSPEQQEHIIRIKPGR